jgi:uncharacterized membrane protein YkvA (DUF1232 family)
MPCSPTVRHLKGKEEEEKKKKATAVSAVAYYAPMPLDKYPSYLPWDDPFVGSSPS